MSRRLKHHQQKKAFFFCCLRKESRGCHGSQVKAAASQITIFNDFSHASVVIVHAGELLFFHLKSRQISRFQLLE